MKTRGWLSDGLAVVAPDERLWTVAQASSFLNEPQADVRWVIRRLNIAPVGAQRKEGPERRGRQPRVYRAVDLIRAYDALAKAA
jgi:hypothetical protein